MNNTAYERPSSSRQLFLSAYYIIVINMLISMFSHDGISFAQDKQQNELLYLKKLTLEELLNVEVTLVSKKPQKLSESAAAIFVISGENIRRSGVTSIPEALRLVPGIQVARINSSMWAISSRGFNGRFANKLLVLIDGRTVYTPLFSGVYWDVQDVILEDIDRIEVIRGPGATMWGANAVNGVINIITRHSKNTQGTLLTAGMGDEEKGFGSLRYGGKAGNNAYFRADAKYFNRDESITHPGDDSNDDWNILRSGFRFDWDRPDSDSLTLHGNIYNGDINYISSVFDNSGPGIPAQLISNETETVSGNFLLGNWHHSYSDVSDMSVQVYWDRTERDIPLISDVIIDTYDIDIHHHFEWGDSNKIIYGAGYRHVTDDISGSFTLSLVPEKDNYNMFSTFFQDEIAIIPDVLQLTIGSKFEHNDYTGFEYQPNVRIIWTPDSENIFWAAISRAVRTPSRGEEDIVLNNMVESGPFIMRIIGNGDADSEELLSYEAGYRLKSYDTFCLDLAVFFNRYDKLRTLEPGLPDMSGFLPVFSLIGRNNMKGDTYGFELMADWQVTDRLRLDAGYSFLEMQLHLNNNSADPTDPEKSEGASPHHQFSLRSSINISRSTQVDILGKYVGSLPCYNIPDYTSLNIRIGRKLTDNLELSLVGQNLLDKRHPEFLAQDFIFTNFSEIERSFYGKIVCHF